MLDMATRAGTQPEDKSVDVLIIGTGFGGIAMAIKLSEAGFSDILLIEKGSDVGGTWRDNIYPGCACDVPSHLYSLSFAQNGAWSRMYPQQPELLAYIREVTDSYALRPKIRFNTTMTEAVWDEPAGRWQVTTSTGSICARVLVSAAGGLHIPAYPALAGLSRFAGKSFHSARWDHDYDLTAKRVAVIGTGASAIQFVPQIAGKVARLDVYQRTPPWILPKPDRVFTGVEQKLLKLAAYRAVFRKYLFYIHELRVLAFMGNKQAQRIASNIARNNLAAQIPDPVLRAKLTPDYTIGCKRVMISNDFYPALARPNVTLITDPISDIRETSIIDQTGIARETDVIIFGTGFEVTTSFRHTRLIGRGGQSLADLWHETGMRALHGIAISGFPNYFMLLGPHTALGHNSVVIMIEAQVGYIVDTLRQMRKRGIGAVDVRAESQAKFIAKLETRLAGTVWQDGGCDSWYKDRHGKVTTIWPGAAGAYQRSVNRADLRDYDFLTTHAAQVTT
ncbi:MAG: NAD(P)/FAD-dependent oxidoreductase [Acidocella sp.]|nr:NAD(P)/FAD-dependent oxidoreductase [Acidocella sp.]